MSNEKVCMCWWLLWIWGIFLLPNLTAKGAYLMPAAFVRISKNECLLMPDLKNEVDLSARIIFLPLCPKQSNHIYLQSVDRKVWRIMWFGQTWLRIWTNDGLFWTLQETLYTYIYMVYMYIIIVQLLIHTHTHTHTYIYIYMCVCVCVYPQLHW